MNTKVCKTCLIEKPTDAYHKHSRCKFGVRNECKLCRVKRQRQYQLDNHCAYKEYQRNHYSENKELYADYQKLNPNKSINSRNEYLRHRKDYIHRSKLYRHKNITPKWADLNKIKSFYLLCPDGFHVDHIIPIRGEFVSGLHVDSNLQIITAEENIKKSNSYKI